MAEPRAASAHKTALWAALFAVFMFGFGYLLVPFYDVFCQLTGFGGRSPNLRQAATSLTADAIPGRRVVVEFDTNVNSGLRWLFDAEKASQELPLGSLQESYFVVTNNSDDWVIAQAVPSIAPPVATRSFHKLECFCFSQQLLAPHEEKRLPLRFLVASDLAEHVDRLTLSYTFFEVRRSAEKLTLEVENLPAGAPHL